MSEIKNLNWKQIPKSETFPADRFDHTLVLHPLQPNKLIVFGGIASGWATKNDTWLLDIESGKCEEITTPSKDTVPPLKDHTAVVIGTNMFVFGGKSTTGAMNQLWSLELNSLVWTQHQLQSPPPITSGHTAVTRNNKMYIWSGQDHDDHYHETLWEFDADSIKWTLIPTKGEKKPFGRVYHSAVVYDKFMFMFGGYNDKKPWNDFWKLDLDTFEWMLLSDNALPDPRSGHVALVKDDIMYIFGGERCKNGTYDTTNDLWTYTFADQSWKSQQPQLSLPPPRVGSRGVVLTNSGSNQFVIFGGLTLEVGPKWQAKNWLSDVWVLTESHGK